MKSSEDLRSRLRSIDHRGYPAYKDLKGQYDFGNYTLSIDHVQGDPFAAPSPAVCDWCPRKEPHFRQNIMTRCRNASPCRIT